MRECFLGRQFDDYSQTVQPINDLYTYLALITLKFRYRMREFQGIIYL